MQYDLYILVYFDDGHPKLFCLTSPITGSVISNLHVYHHSFSQKMLSSFNNKD